MEFIILLLYIALIVAVIAGWWKMFEKAGEPGWAAIVPIYNLVVLFRIAGRPWWWVLLLLIPIVSLVIVIIVMLDLAKNFGKGVLFAIFGLILFTPIGVMMLGFGDARYQGQVEHEAAF